MKEEESLELLLVPVSCTTSPSFYCFKSRIKNKPQSPSVQSAPGNTTSHPPSCDGKKENGPQKASDLCESHISPSSSPIITSSSSQDFPVFPMQPALAFSITVSTNSSYPLNITSQKQGVVLIPLLSHPRPLIISQQILFSLLSKNIPNPSTPHQLYR